ncbi:MAG: DUF4185 domain-containing protein [Caldilineales bacterium]
MLVAPTVIPPVTPWSPSIRVKGQLSGAVVAVYADGQRVGGALAASGDIFVPLDPGFVLQPGQRITASQEKDGDKSGDTAPASAVTVLNDPSPQMLGMTFSRAPLLACGTCLWLEGVVPGADVSVTVGAAPPVTVSAEWTAVHVDVARLSPTETVAVRQRRGPVVGPVTTLPAPKPQPENAIIPPPKVTEPLYQCDRMIELTDIRPGAQITVEHAGNATDFCFGSVNGTFWLARGLALGDTLVVKQEFPLCELRGDESKYETTAAVPPTPWFLYPICSGDRDVEVGGLRPGASVQFLIGRNSGKIVPGEAGEPPHRFNLPPMGNVMQLGVRQSLCDGGPWSDTAWTSLIPVGSLDQPRIEEPVHQCGVAVGIQGLTAGTRVHVVSRFWGGSIGSIVAVGEAYTDVPLQFPLIAGDTLTPELVRCGQLRTADGSAEVQPAPEELPPPLIFEPLDDAGGTVTVDRLVPGAFCDIEQVTDPGDTFGTLIASHPATHSQHVSVPVPTLAPGLLVLARQRLCGHASRASLVVRTGDRPLDYEGGSTDRIGALTGVRGHGMRPARVDSTPFGLTGTDLGVPALHNGRVYLFFGDCDESEQMEADADPIAWTTDAPDTPGGPYLNWLLGNGGIFHRLQVDGLPKLGNFEVPTGAFSYHGRLYVFVAREKVDERMQTSHLAVTKQPGNNPNETLELVYDVASTLSKNPPPPAGRWLVHASPTVVRCADWPGLPETSGDGVVLFGTSLYHDSNAYLAFFPLRYTSVSVPLGPFGPTTLVPPPIPHPSTWWYYVAGAPAAGTFPANWRPAAALPPGGPTKLLPDFDWLGEISATWHPPLRRWLMSYLAHNRQIVVRSARAPWGPWSRPEVIFDGTDPTYQATADNLIPGHQFMDLDHDWENRKTTVYAPYLVPAWTRFDRSIRKLTLFYTLSTEHPPYNVQLMKSSLLFQ